MNHLKYLTVILFSFLSFAGANIHAQSGWQNINSYHPYRYSDCQFVSNNVVYLCGNFNGVAKSVAGGTNIEFKNNGIPSGKLFSRVQFFDEQKGMIYGNGIYKTLDGGDSWNSIYDLSVGSVSFVNMNTGYACIGSPNKIIKTINGGLNWIEIAASSEIITNILFINELTGYRHDYSGSIKKTTDGGITWGHIMNTSSLVRQFKKVNDNIVIAVDYDCNVYKFTVSNNSWKTIYHGDFFPNNLSVINDNSFVVTSSTTPEAYITTDGGGFWAQRILPMAGYIFPNSADDALFSSSVFGSEGLFKLSNNWNNVVNVFQDEVTENLVDVSIFDKSNFYVLADSNYLIKTTDGGARFTKQRMDFSSKSMSFINLSTGYCSYKDKLLRTYNGGASWDTVYKFIPGIPGRDASVSGVNFLNENFGYMYAEEKTPYPDNSLYGVMKVTTNGGASWTEIFFSSFTGNSHGWTSYSSGDFQMFPNGTGYRWSTSGSGNFYTSKQSPTEVSKTTNYGAAWTSVTPGNALPEPSKKISFVNESTGYILTGDGKFYKTVNAGSSWSILSSFEGNTSDLYMIDEMNGYIINQVKFYRTTDGGITWTLQLPPELNNTLGCNKISFVNPEMGLIISKRGLILKTTTGGMVSVNNISQLTEGYALSQNYPNPFNPVTNIKFSIPKNGIVKVLVYDMLGREVKELVNEFKQTGTYSVSFDGANFSSGIYFYKLITNDFVETKKMILVK